MVPTQPHSGRDGVAGVASDVVESVEAAASAAAAAIKPRLRGWSHVVMAPLALAYGIVLISLAPAGAPRVSVIVYAISTVLLFGTSAIYHRGTWSPRAAAVLRRMDHSNIFLLIAGTYTPLSVLLLPATTARVLLIVVWSGAVIGILMRILWLGAPRWLYVPIYVALGWVAVWFLPSFGRAGGPAVMWLVTAGGLAYTIGALVYGLKRPNPSPRWFGFHEIFHVGTIVGATCHAIAIGIALVAIR